MSFEGKSVETDPTIWKEIVAQDSPDVWSLVECGVVNTGQNTDLDILLPNGFLLVIKFNTDRTLSSLKQEVFDEAKKLPLNESLLSPSDYIFFTVGSSGEYNKLYDETRSIFSLRLFVPLLCLIEPEGNREEKELAHDIGLAIGYPLSNIESKLNYDHESYRMNLNRVLESAISTRSVSGYSHYAFPEEVANETDPEISSQLKSKIEVADLFIEVWYRSVEDEVENNDANCLCVKVKGVLGIRTQDLIRYALREVIQHHKIMVTEHLSEYLLQIAGRRSFLTKNLKLTSFQYVRSCFENYRIPKFLLRRRDIVLKDYAAPSVMTKPSWLNAYESRLNKSNEGMKRCNLWDLDDYLKIRVNTASHITISDIDWMYVKAGLYHGPNLIVTKESVMVCPANPRWVDGWIEFDVYLKDIPNAAQLCLSLIAVKEKKKDILEHSGIGWVNLRLFNWNNQMVQGKKLLYLWPFPKHCTDLIYPLGQSGLNDDRHTARLEIEFCDYGSIVEFPSQQVINAYRNKMNMRNVMMVSPASSFAENSPDIIELRRLEMRLGGDNLNEDQQQLIWRTREYIAVNLPDLLPLLANILFIWMKRENYIRFYELLENWSQIRAETALGLLDFKYPDPKLREFAVSYLDSSLDSNVLHLYIMPLIQALKFEAFDINALSEMLLKRALYNYRIGHTLFWLLRSELAQIGEVGEDIPKMYIRFALLIEAYCRGNAVHVRSILKQIDMVAHLTELSKMVKYMKDKDAAAKILQSELSKHKEEMQDMSSPLDPHDSLGKLNVSLCKIIGSAKRPLWLSWMNSEPLAILNSETHQIIFKNGDDLRQDMLTLQAMRIMDALWKENDLDMCLSIYEVLPMGKNIGMIRVVQNCYTLFEIQCAAKQLGSTFSMENSLINKWIRSCSEDSKMYLEGVDRFTESCAGYCVATYVLGIKDRHQDNIMLARDGRLFHIDFGHFLGHYKKKLGINRDRVPFVLTDHFLYVISKGKGNYRDGHEYKKFKQLCIDAYLILRDRARLFISLFTMMLCMGLPELQTMENVNYLKTTLCIEMDRKGAASSFNKIFDEAFSGAWSTKTNWFFHSVKHL